VASPWIYCGGIGETDFAAESTTSPLLRGDRFKSVQLFAGAYAFDKGMRYAKQVPQRPQGSRDKECVSYGVDCI
jgi:hypothetical protein